MTKAHSFTLTFFGASNPEQITPLFMLIGLSFLVFVNSVECLKLKAFFMA
jgi:hypothetical protein